jgi:hypothetical protein
MIKADIWSLGVILYTCDVALKMPIRISAQSILAGQYTLPVSILSLEAGNLISQILPSGRRNGIAYHKFDSIHGASDFPYQSTKMVEPVDDVHSLIANSF